jgi:hypothetical protein
MAWKARDYCQARFQEEQGVETWTPARITLADHDSDNYEVVWLEWLKEATFEVLDPYKDDAEGELKNGLYNSSQGNDIRALKWTAEDAEKAAIEEEKAAEQAAKKKAEEQQKKAAEQAKRLKPKGWDGVSGSPAWDYFTAPFTVPTDNTMA